MEQNALKTKMSDPSRMAVADIPGEVLAVFESHPFPIREKLLELRQLILRTARETHGVGILEEALRWGEPSYLTSESRSGTTIRISRVKGSDAKVGIFVHCQTTLIETFRQMYPDEFEYMGNRALVLHVNDPIPEQALSHCIALALCYHLDQK